MGQPKAQNVTQTNKVELSPQQQEIFDMALPSIKNYASSTPQLFPGTGIAGFNPLEVQGQNYATGPAFNAAKGLASSAAGAQSFLLDPEKMLNPNQYVTSAMDALTGQVTRNLNENILPGIRSTSAAAAGPYAHNTKEGIAQGLAIGRTNQGLSDSLADMLLKNYTTGLGAMSGAIAQNPSVLQSQLFPSNILSAVGGQNRAMEQAKLDESIRQFYGQQDLDLNRAQQLLGLISGMPGATGVSSVTPAQPKTDPMMQAIGLGLNLLGMSMGMPGMGTGMGMGMPMGK